jgi:hypothetical protein
MLNKIHSNNYYANGLPGAAPAANATPQAGPMETIAQGTLGNVQDIKNFQTIMPQDTWNNVFDEWTRNFATEYVLPEWQAQTYNPTVEDMTRSLGNMNQQMGVTGAWRSGGAQNDLQRAAQEALKQEENLRTQYQSDIAKLRDSVLTTWATPTYEDQMRNYNNSPLTDLNLSNISNNAAGIINNLGSQYGVTDASALEELIGNLSNTNMADAPAIPTYDWSAHKANLSLIEQYK